MKNKIKIVILQKNTDNFSIKIERTKMYYGELATYLTLKQAADWAASYTKKDVTPSNIAYLVQLKDNKAVKDNIVYIDINDHKFKKNDR